MAELLLELGNVTITCPTTIEIWENSFYMFYGSEKNGKTATLFYICNESLKKGKKVVYFDLENRYDKYTAPRDELYVKNFENLKKDFLQYSFDKSTKQFDFSSIMQKLQDYNEAEIIIIDNFSFMYKNIGLKTQISRQIEKLCHLLLLFSKDKTLIISCDFSMKKDKLTGYKTATPKVPKILRSVAEKMIRVCKEFEINSEQIFHYWNFHSNKIPFIIEKTGVIIKEKIG